MSSLIIFLKLYFMLIFAFLLNHVHSLLINPCNGSIDSEINDFNSTLIITPSLSTEFSSNMSCFWKIAFITYDFETVVQMWQGFNIYSNNVLSNEIMYEFRIWNCDSSGNDFILIQRDSNAFGQNNYFYTEESNICVSFQSFDIPTNDSIIRTWFLNLTLVSIARDTPTVLTKEDPLNVLSGYIYFNTYTFIAEQGTLEIFVGQDSYTIIQTCNYYIYEAENLTNFLTSSQNKYIDQFFLFANSTLTIFYTCDSNGAVQTVVRITEEFSPHCANSPNSTLGYASSNLISNINVTAKSTGFCIFSVVVPYQTSYFFTTYNVLNLISFKYEGDSNVEVVKGYKNDNASFILFELNEETEESWNNTVVYGSLISFIIPPKGNLQVAYQAVNYIPKQIQTFQDYGEGIFMSVNYPIKGIITMDIDSAMYITCTHGYANYEITIVYAEILINMTLQILDGDSILDQFENQTIKSVTKFYNETQSLIIKITDTNSFLDLRYWSGFLIKYKGMHINTTTTTEPPKSSRSTTPYLWAIILGVVVIVVSFVLIIIYLIYRLKSREKHFEQLFDILKDMHLSHEDIEALRTKTDEFLIEKDNLQINFDNIIGKGSTSIVYRGYIVGSAPLHSSMKSIQTQQFMDCAVAVKMAANFGQNEVENLFQEIKAMKLLGLHTNIISLLGWCMYKESPCIAFELASQDLLGYVKLFRQNIEDVSQRIFLSILWQVLQGMQYISSKGLIHRDIAARNILICENNVAKISDFGLICTTAQNSTYQASLHKKLPMKWLPIEALSQRIFSDKSDVWSFGVLMYEMYSLGKVPYENLNSTEVLEFLQAGNRLECPELANEEIYNIMRACWEEEPDSRPNFGALSEDLRIMLEKLTEYYGYLI